MSGNVDGNKDVEYEMIPVLVACGRRSSLRHPNSKPAETYPGVECSCRLSSSATPATNVIKTTTATDGALAVNGHDLTSIADQ